MSKLTVLPDPSTGHANYPAVDVASIRHIAVFPPIGISRVGDSNECFLAPEVHAQTSPPKSPDGREYMFRDAHQKLRRQAVRFRVYAYDANKRVLGELNTKNGYTLTWKVDVANKKAAARVFQSRFPPHNTRLRNETVHPGETDPDKRSKLIVEAQGEISAGTQTSFINLHGKFQGSKDTTVDVDLAQLQVDEAGRLVFVPAKGGARSVADPNNPQPPVLKAFDNDDWIDEVCDGTVTVKVTGHNIPANIPVLGAWVLSAPPNFAWGINLSTNLYDIMEDVYHQATNPRPQVEVDFWKHIWPVLESASLMSWTNDEALRGHGETRRGHYDAKALFELFKGPTEDPAERRRFKTRIFDRLRKRLDNDDPDPNQANVRFMPRLSGDAGDLPGNPPDAKRFAALTRLQYERFQKWTEDDNFHLTGDGPPVPQSKLENHPAINQPDQITRAVLESTVGDPLYPGIEIYWTAKSRDTYNTGEARINPPFRINGSVLPGHLGRGLSLPWQCDFDMCNTHWWPSVRPDDVVVKSTGGVQTNERIKWKRGIPNPGEALQGKHHTGPAPRANYPGSDEMIKHWTQFGVVREVKTAPNGELRYLEDEHVVSG